jgi:hypothetical protein
VTAFATRAPRFVGLVLSETDEDLPWQRVVRADGSLPKGAKQRQLLLREGVPMRGERVDMKEARFPPDLEVQHSFRRDIREKEDAMASATQEEHLPAIGHHQREEVG